MSTNTTSPTAATDGHQGSKGSEYVLLVSPTFTDMLDCPSKLVPDLHCKWQSEDYPAKLKATMPEIVFDLYSKCMTRGTGGLKDPALDWPDRVKLTVSEDKDRQVTTYEGKFSVAVHYIERPTQSCKSTGSHNKRLKIFTGDDMHRVAQLVPSSKTNVADSSNIANGWNETALEGIIAQQRSEEHLLWYVMYRGAFHVPDERRLACSQDVWDKYVIATMAASFKARCWTDWAPELVSLDTYREAGGKWPPEEESTPEFGL